MRTSFFFHKMSLPFSQGSMKYSQVECFIYYPVIKTQSIVFNFFVVECVKRTYIYNSQINGVNFLIK